MKKQMIVISTFATILMSAWSAQAQQAGLSDYYLAPVEAEIQAHNHANSKAGAVAGIWLTQSGNLEVEISKCGQALCGKVSRVLETSAAPAMGKTIMEGFTPVQTAQSTQPATWSGKIFNRADGQTYDCQMRMLSSGELEVTPYKDSPENGRSQVWTRVSNTVTAQK